MDVVVIRQFLPKAVHQGGDATHGLVLVELGIGHELGQLGHSVCRRAVVHNALTQGDGSGMLAHQLGNGGDDGAVHRIHAGRLAFHGVYRD